MTVGVKTTIVVVRLTVGFPSIDVATITVGSLLTVVAKVTVYSLLIVDVKVTAGCPTAVRQLFNDCWLSNDCCR